MNVCATATAAAAIAASPLIWNVVARNEYRNGTMTWLLGGKKPAAYTMAAWIFFSSLFRDWLFQRAVGASSLKLASTEGAASAMWTVGAGLVGSGSVFVLSSMWRLGITGTYLGDYFGIYMDAMVTGFPFNVMANPMYNGATMCFLGQALMENSVVGAGLSAWVLAVYTVATTYFEGPFTNHIYEELAKRKADKSE